MQHRIPKNKLMQLKKFIEKKPKVRLISGPGKSRAFVFEFEGKLVYAKQTHKKKEEGDVRIIRERIVEHNIKSRKGIIKADKYLVKLPAAYGIHGDYLLMEYIERKEKPNKGTKEYASYLEAIDQLQRNIFELQKISDYPLDTNHLIYAGLKNGKHVFVLPYDYAY